VTKGSVTKGLVTEGSVTKGFDERFGDEKFSDETFGHQLNIVLVPKNFLAFCQKISVTPFVNGDCVNKCFVIHMNRLEIG